MKKNGRNVALYAALAVLLAATLILGGFGSGMFMNYLFLAIMGGLIYCMDKYGLRRITQITEDLRHITDSILGGRDYRQFVEEMAEDAAQSNDRYLELMEQMNFRQQAANEDWHRLLKDWQLSEGMDCEVEEYLFEEEMLEYCNNNVCSQMPGILTAMGILGTFLGLVLGLQSFDFSNADQMTSSVEALVGGLNVAFYTSIYGVSLSILYNVIFRRTLTNLSRELNLFYDVFHAALKPVSQKELLRDFCENQDVQSELLQDIQHLMEERFGERLAGQMAETLTPVFERINESLDHIILDFHKEQAASLEKIVDAFVLQMSGALNSHVEVLGQSVDQLSMTQQNMSAELQQLIGQIARTGSDTARINEQAGEILKQLSGYVPQLERTARDSAEIIAQMGQWSESIRTMSAAQNDILKTLSVHEGNLDETCAKINSNQEILNNRLVDFTKAAEVLAEREKDPLQFKDLKEMLSAYMSSMQQIENANAQRMEKLFEKAAAEDREEYSVGQYMIIEQLEKMMKIQQDMVYLNGRIAGILSGQSNTGGIKLPSSDRSADDISAEQRMMKAVNDRMDAWMRNQETFQKEMLKMAQKRNRSVFEKIRDMIIRTEI